MEMIYSYLAIALGIALRIGIPILITVLISIYLHRLDERWQAEGEEMEAVALVENRSAGKSRAACPNSAPLARDIFPHCPAGRRAGCPTDTCARNV